LLPVLFLLASCADIKPKKPVEFVFDRNQELPPVACLYHTKVITLNLEKGTRHSQEHDDHLDSSQPSEWYLWRDGKRVEIQSLFSTEGEVWERLNSGDVTFTWLYHNKKFAIHYAPSDLNPDDCILYLLIRNIGTLPKIFKLSTVVGRINDSVIRQ